MVKMGEMQDKDFEAKGGKYFDAGVHEVYINDIKRGVASTGSEFVEVEVTDKEAERTANTRLYLTDKTAERSRSILAGIAVHNKDTEADKQKVRDAFKKITDTDQLDDKFLSRLENMQAWISAEEDTSAPKPNGGFYLRYNLFSYEPKPRQQTAEQLVADLKNNSTPASTDNIPF
jgi:hypothetical protein